MRASAGTSLQLALLRLLALLLLAAPSHAAACDPHNEHDIDHTSCYPQCSFVRSRALECVLCKCKACAVCTAGADGPPSPPPPRPYWWKAPKTTDAQLEGDALDDDDDDDRKDEDADPEDAAAEDANDEPESAADSAEKALMGIFAKHPPPSPPPPSPPPRTPSPTPSSPPPAPPSPPPPPPHPSNPPNQPRAKPGEPGSCATTEIDLTQVGVGVSASASSVERPGFEASNAGASRPPHPPRASLLIVLPP